MTRRRTRDRVRCRLVPSSPDSRNSTDCSDSADSFVSSLAVAFLARLHPRCPRPASPCHATLRSLSLSSLAEHIHSPATCCTKLCATTLYSRRYAKLPVFLTRSLEIARRINQQVGTRANYFLSPLLETRRATATGKAKAFV